MNSTIATILKQLRKSSRLSVKQASIQLKQYGIDIASKTLYGYESGISMPNADVFVALCKIYQSGESGGSLPPSTVYGRDEGVQDEVLQNKILQNKIAASEIAEPNISQEELSFLDDFKALDSFGQDLVRQVMKHEKDRVRQMHGLPGD